MRLGACDYEIDDLTYQPQLLTTILQLITSILTLN